MPTIHLIIKGKVQGVFYRASARKAALSLGLNGWVRNNDNGEVEALVTGTAERLDTFTEWCKAGPDGASVTEVIRSEKEEMNFDSFAIRH